MRLMWWVLFAIYSYMIICGFFGIYYSVLEEKFVVIKPFYMEAILSYFKNGTIPQENNEVVEPPFFEIVLIAFGSIGFYLTSRFYRKVKKLGFA